MPSKGENDQIEIKDKVILEYCKLEKSFEGSEEGYLGKYHRQ